MQTLIAGYNVVPYDGIARITCHSFASRFEALLAEASLLPRIGSIDPIVSQLFVGIKSLQTYWH
jgi:hypothetical protein